MEEESVCFKGVAPSMGGPTAQTGLSGLLALGHGTKLKEIEIWRWIRKDGEKELGRGNKVSVSGQYTDRDSEDDQIRDTTAGGEAVAVVL